MRKKLPLQQEVIGSDIMRQFPKNIKSNILPLEGCTIDNIPRSGCPSKFIPKLENAQKMTKTLNVNVLAVALEKDPIGMAGVGELKKKVSLRFINLHLIEEQVYWNCIVWKSLFQIHIWNKKCDPEVN